MLSQLDSQAGRPRERTEGVMPTRDTVDMILMIGVAEGEFKLSGVGGGLSLDDLLSNEEGGSAQSG